jgi:hypothetical protein
MSEPWQGILAIHPENFCGTLLDDDFVPNIDFALLQDQDQPRLRCLWISMTYNIEKAVSEY